MRRIKILFCLLLCLYPFSWRPAAAGAESYDIVYVRIPRAGDNVFQALPDALDPLIAVPGSDLMLLHPDGTEEVLFPAGANGAAADPSVSPDGRSVVFAFFHNAAEINGQRGLSTAGADIYRIDLRTRAVLRLTTQTLTPNTGNGADFNCARTESNCPRVGVFNVGPAFLPDGRIVFTTTRDNFLPNRTFGTGQRALQLWVMDGDGRNADSIGQMNLGAAEHPFVLRDGRVVFTSWENMGVRSNQVFPLWSIWPDGTNFESFAGFGDWLAPKVHHFMTQLSSGDIVVCRYYTSNNNGFGELYRFPVNGNGAGILFTPIPAENAPPDTVPLQRIGYTPLTPFTNGEDDAAPCRTPDPARPGHCVGGNLNRVGKFTQPSAAPNNEMLVVYTPGAGNHNGIVIGAGRATPFYDAGIYRMRGDQPLQRPEDLALIKNSPAYHEMWPRAVVSYQQIHGVAAPQRLAGLRNDGKLDARLPEGTPFALVGTSSMIARDTRPFRGDSFYPHINNGQRNWTNQGADAGIYADDDIYAVRILAMQPLTDRTYPDNARGFASHFSERIRILGEIPVRKEGVFDAQGNVDTSFLAKIPADVPFTFQTLDRNGLVLNMAQTWHHLRPGERNVGCGGCHAHSQAPLSFAGTAASKPDYLVRDLATTTPLLAVDGTRTPGTTTLAAKSTTVEYLRDIRPILQAKCASCHTAKNGRQPEAGLNLDDDDRLIRGFLPASYAALTQPPGTDNPTRRSIAPDGAWYEPQMSRYVRAGQARQSLLAWKIFGRRLDGRRNEDRPTERVPGDATTLPAGVNWVDCDLDFTGTQMPPPDSGATLSWEERMKIARWIDLGAPIELTDLMRARGAQPFGGFFEDDLRPTLALGPSVEEAVAAGSIGRFVIGAYDLESGIDPASLSLTLNRPVGTIAAGANLAVAATIADGGTVTINLPATLSPASGEIVATLRIRDRAGHTTQIVRSYRTASGPFALASVSAASYASALLAPESIVAAFGAGLATTTQAAPSTPLPTDLAGTSIRARDSAGIERLAPLFFVSASQINYLMPPGMANGMATITANSGSGALSLGTVAISAVAPGLFTANASGQGLAAAAALRVRADGSQSYEPIVRFDSTQNRLVAVPIDLGPTTDQVFLLLFGTGLRNRTALAAVSARIGATNAPVLFAGAQDGFVGLDQINVQLPRSLAGSGETDLLLTVDGRTANLVRIAIK